MTDTYRVVISSRAAAELSVVHDYIATDSPQNAAGVAFTIVKAIDSLNIFPERFPIYRGRRQLTRQVRRMPVAPVLVYYKIDEQSHIVEIISIRHGKRRPPRSVG